MECWVLVRIRGVNCRCLGAVRWLGCLEGSLGFLEEGEERALLWFSLNYQLWKKVEGEGEAAGSYLEGGGDLKCKRGE